MRFIHLGGVLKPVLPDEGSAASGIYFGTSDGCRQRNAASDASLAFGHAKL